MERDIKREDRWGKRNPALADESGGDFSSQPVKVVMSKRQINMS